MKKKKKSRQISLEKHAFAPILRFLEFRNFSRDRPNDLKLLKRANEITPIEARKYEREFGRHIGETYRI